MSGSDPPRLCAPPGHPLAPPQQPDEQPQANPASPFLNFMLSFPPDLQRRIITTIPNLPSLALSCKAARLLLCSTAVTSITLTQRDATSVGLPPAGMADRYPALTHLKLMEFSDPETPDAVKAMTQAAGFLRCLSMEEALLARVARLDVSMCSPAEDLAHSMQGVLDACTALTELSMELSLQNVGSMYGPGRRTSECCSLLLREERQGRRLPPGLGGILAGIRQAMLSAEVGPHQLEEGGEEEGTALLAGVTSLTVRLDLKEASTGLPCYLQHLLNACTSLTELGMKLKHPHYGSVVWAGCELLLRKERPGRQLPQGMGAVFAGMYQAMQRAISCSDSFRLMLPKLDCPSLLPALKSLTLSGGNNSTLRQRDTPLPIIPQLVHLTRLELQLGNEPHLASRLSGLHLPHLKELALDGGKYRAIYDDNTFNTVECSLPTGLHALTKMSASNGLVLSPNLRTQTSMQHLTLSRCYIKMTAASLSSDLQSLAALTYLRIDHDVRALGSNSHGSNSNVAASLALQGATSLEELTTWGGVPVHIPTSLTSLTAQLRLFETFMITDTWLCAVLLRYLDVEFVDRALEDLSQAVHAIAQLTSLQHLRLRDSHSMLVEGDGVAVDVTMDVSPLDSLTGLTYLELHTPRLTGLTYLQLFTGGPLVSSSWPAAIQGAANLRHLDVCTSDREYSLVWPIPALPSSLTHLAISQQTADFDLPQHLTSCSNLEELKIACPHFSQLSGTSHLTALTSLSRLVFHSPHQWYDGSNGLDATSQLEAVARLTHLQHLSLDGLDAADISCLDALSLLTHLTVRPINGAQLVGELPGPLLRAAQWCQRLRKVDIHRGGYSDSDSEKGDDEDDEEDEEEQEDWESLGGLEVWVDEEEPEGRRRGGGQRRGGRRGGEGEGWGRWRGGAGGAGGGEGGRGGGGGGGGRQGIR